MTEMDLYYSEFGTATAEPLVILHGFFASSRNWRLVAEKFAAHYRVIVLDMRNHGQSPHDSSMNYPVMANDLERFLDRHALGQVNLLGHSMGGKVAMWFGLNFPERVSNLVIADIAPVSYQHNFDYTIDALKSLPLADIKNRKQAEDWLADYIPELSYRQFLLQNLVLSQSEYRWRINLDVFAKTADNIVAFPKADHLLPYLGRCLFIAGENSTFVEADDLYGLFPNAQLETIADAGHWLHVQQPKIFIDKVLNFLKQ